MIHEAEVTFELVKPLVFIHSSDESSIVKGVTYNYFLYTDRDKIVFMDQNNHPICRLYLSPYQIQVENGLLQIRYPQEDKKYHKDHPSHSQSHQAHTNQKNTNQQQTSQKREEKSLTLIASIKTSEKAINQISQICPKRKYKSCLSFTPSNIEHISILSGESPTQKFRGFLNLIGVMFIILNIRNMVDNFYRYGYRFQNQPFEFLPIEAFIGTFSLLMFVGLAYNVEKLRFSHVLKDTKARFVLKVNQVLVLVYLVMFCRKYLENNPISAVGFTCIGVITFLKLISYAQVNSELNQILHKLNELSEIQFDQFIFANHEITKDNLELIKKHQFEWSELVNMNKLGYFLIAPTLCYQLCYPRATVRRYPWLVKRIIQFGIMCALMLVLWVQYIEPELALWFNIMEGQKYQYLDVFYRLLRLSIPNTIGWILGFYTFFHLFLNIISEIILFGDRNFYMDWWNCRNLEEYWKTWNLPVHFWFIRHCYTPLLKIGYNKIAANFTVFILSAIAHQFLVCVPLGLVSYYAFLAMLIQAPVIFIEKKLSATLKLHNSELGNVSFWLFFCVLGQPTCVFIYYSLYMEKSYAESRVLNLQL